MSGEHNEKIIGDKLTSSIGGSIFKLKLTSRLTQDRPVNRVTDTIGSDFGFGAGNHGFSAIIDASTPDMSTISGWNNRDSNGELPVQAVVMTFPPKGGGASVTASFNAKFPHVEFDQPDSEGNVKVILKAVITSQTITWG